MYKTFILMPWHDMLKIESQFNFLNVLTYRYPSDKTSKSMYDINFRTFEVTENEQIP